MDRTGSELSEEKNEQKGRVQGYGEEKNKYDGFRLKSRNQKRVDSTGWNIKVFHYQVTKICGREN